MDEAGGGIKTLLDYAAEMGMDAEKVKYGTIGSGKAFSGYLDMIFDQLEKNEEDKKDK